MYETAGVPPTTSVLYNEFSKDMQSTFQKENVTFHLVPPHNHRANAAERAIQTFKNHFIAGLSGIDPHFPISQWDRLLEQATLTLNLLRSSRLNPKLSAQAFLFGQFDFAATPLAPPGTKIVAHVKPGQRRSWAPRGNEGWYIGPALDHYRCVKCYFPQTRSERVIDTLTFLPHRVPFPTIKIDTFLRQAATDIVSLLKHPPNTTFPTLQQEDATYNAICKISDLLQRTDTSSTNEVIESAPKLPSPEQHNQLPITSIPPPVSFPRVMKNTPLPRVVPMTPIPRVITATPPTPPSVPISTSTSTRLSKNLVHTSPHKSIPLTPTKYILPVTCHRLLSKHKYPLRSRGTNFCQMAAQYLVAQYDFSNHINHIYDQYGAKQSLDQLLKGTTHITCIKALSNELGRLATGNIHGVQSTNCTAFIPHTLVPKNKKVTYANFVCDHRPLKSEPWRVRLVVGGNRLEYYADPGSPTATLVETKLLVNSVISDADKGARFACCALKDFFLATPMASQEYMKIHKKYLLLDIITHHNLQSIMHNDYVYCQINKGMYGLKQAATFGSQATV